MPPGTEEARETVVAWQRSANGAISAKTGTEWYNAHKARIRKGLFSGSYPGT